MEKIKEFFNKYKNYILIILLVFLALKSCKTCTLQNRYKYQEIQKEFLIDSMQSIIDNYENNNKYLKDTIYSLKNENTILKEVIVDLKADKKHFQTTNKNLTNVANKLSNRDTIK